MAHTIVFDSSRDDIDRCMFKFEAKIANRECDNREVALYCIDVNKRVGHQQFRLASRPSCSGGCAIENLHILIDASTSCAGGNAFR